MFDCQPTLGDNPTARRRGQPSKHQGKYWIGGYEKYQGKPGQKPGTVQGDGPQGTLTSPPFTIPSGTLNFLIGGGGSFRTRVELIVSGKRVLHASGRNTETMRRVEWDLSPYAGKTGRIRIVDKSSGGWGHINVDDFRFKTAQLVSSTHEDDLVGSWKGCDGRVVTFTLEDGQYIGRYTQLADLGKYHFTPNEIGYRAFKTQDGKYVGGVKWRSTSGQQEWRPTTITIKGGKYTDTGSDNCSKQMRRQP